MLNVPESVKHLYLTDGINKNFRVHFPNGEHEDLTNKDVVNGSVKFTESVCSKDVLQFGLSEDSSIEFECVNVPNIFGVTIECGNEIDITSLTAAEIQEIQEGTWDGTLVLAENSDIGYGYFHVPYGVFVVRACPRSQDAMSHREVTAYNENTADFKRMSLNYYSPFSKLKISDDALIAMRERKIDSTKFVETRHSFKTTIFFNFGQLYDKNKKSWNVYVSGEMTARQTSDDITQGDFVIADYSPDEEKNDALGMAVVKVLDDNNYSFLYDKNGKKIYPDNETALRRCFPSVFYPSLMPYHLEDKDKKYSTSLSDYSIKVFPNTVTPLPSNLVGSEERVLPFEASGGWHGNDFAFEWVDSVYGNITVSLLPDGGKQIDYEDIEVEPFENHMRSISSYKLADGISENYIEVSPTLQNKTYYYTPEVLNLKTEKYGAGRRLAGYSFINSFSYNDAYAGIYESKGLFSTKDRYGNFASKKLSKSTPTVITKNEYLQLYYEEYDVEDIGTVKVAFNDGKSVSEVKIGDGESVYDMTDNAYFDKFATVDDETATAKISSIISSDFKTNAEHINFTPASMTMVGLPYLEAGDYLKVILETPTATVIGHGSETPATFSIEGTVYPLISSKVKAIVPQSYQYGKPYAANKGWNHMPFPYEELRQISRGGVSCANVTKYGYKEYLEFSGVCTGYNYWDAFNGDSYGKFHLNAGNYRLDYVVKDGANLSKIGVRLYGKNPVAYIAFTQAGVPVNFTLEEPKDIYVLMYIYEENAGESFDGCGFVPIITNTSETSDSTTYRPYENRATYGTVPSTLQLTHQNGGNTNTYEAQIPVETGEVVYGCYADFTTGELAKTHACIESYNGEDIPDHWLSDIDLWEHEGDKPTIGAKVVYEVTPTKYSIPTETIAVGTGENTFTTGSDCDVEITYRWEEWIDTFMLHRELSGVQTLFDDVEANGGEVLEDD